MDRLLKIGYEGFRMLEEEENGRKSGRPATASRQKAPAAAAPVGKRRPEPSINPACHYQYQPQKPVVHQLSNPVSSSQETITTYDAIKLHDVDGLLIVDYSKRKSAAMAY